jgi:glycosyltransferase involved in cell wall biosynthesis
MRNRVFIVMISWLRTIIRPRKHIAGNGLRIALVDTFGEIGGGQKQLLDFAICSQTREKAFIIAIVNASNHAFIALLRDAGISYHCVEADLKRDRNNRTIFSLGNMRRVLRQAMRVRKVIIDNKINVLQCFNFHSSIIGVMLGLSRTKCKLMMMHLSRRNQTPGGMLDYLTYLVADAVTYNSKATKKSYESVAELFSVPQNILYSLVLPPVSVSNELSIGENGRFSNGDKNRKIIGYFGSIIEWKNIDRLIKAVKLANETERSQSFFAVIVGGYVGETETEYETKIKDLANSLIPEHHVIVPQQRDVFSIMNECDVLVLPSEEEPYGRVLVEAMYLRVPFVAVDSGGPREIWETSGPTAGSLVPSNDVNALAAAIAEQARLGRARHMGLPSKFSVDEIINSHYEFLYALWNAKGAAESVALTPN